MQQDQHHQTREDQGEEDKQGSEAARPIRDLLADSRSRVVCLRIGMAKR